MAPSSLQVAPLIAARLLCVVRWHRINGMFALTTPATCITRLMDTIQKAAAQIIEVIETRLLGEYGDGEATDEAPHIPATLSDDRALVGVQIALSPSHAGRRHLDACGLRGVRKRSRPYTAQQHGAHSYRISGFTTCGMGARRC